jgi:hypothetical protein
MHVDEHSVEQQPAQREQACQGVLCQVLWQVSRTATCECATQKSVEAEVELPPCIPTDEPMDVEENCTTNIAANQDTILRHKINSVGVLGRMGRMGPCSAFNFAFNFAQLYSISHILILFTQVQGFPMSGKGGSLDNGTV